MNGTLVTSVTALGLSSVKGFNPGHILALLDFRYEIKGSAEIITKDRRLIQRFFDNLKYIVEK